MVKVEGKNEKAKQLLHDFDPETVEEGIEDLKRKNAFLIEKSLRAEEGEYIAAEDADEQIEHLKAANQELLQKVGSIAKMVASAVKKARNDHVNRRKKRREEVVKLMHEEELFEDQEIKEMVKEKQKLKAIRDEINSMKQR